MGVVIAGAAPLAGPHSPGAALPTDASTRTLEETTRQVIEAPRLVLALLSPDGNHALYSVSRQSVATNRQTTAVFMQALRAGQADGAPRRLNETEERTGTLAGLAWCPDNTCVTYFQQATDATPGRRTLVRQDLASGQIRPLLVREVDPTTATAAGRQIASVEGPYKWSPSGRWIAFVAKIGITQPPSPTVGVAVTPALLRESRLQFNKKANRGLFVLEAETGRLELVSPTTLDVQGADWAPDERALAVSVTGDEGLGYYGSPQSDIYIVDRGTRRARPLVVQPGPDDAPAWSPDGQWIAFRSAFGAPAGRPHYRLGVVASAGGPAEPLTGLEDPLVEGGLGWMADNRRIYFTAMEDMRNPVYRLDRDTRRLAPWQSADGLIANGRISLSADQRSALFRRKAGATPDELMIQAGPEGPVAPITQFAAEVDLGAHVRVDPVEWPSRDRQFTIHGLLVTPRAVWTADGPKGKVRTPLPTAVYIHGGPGMPSNEFPIGAEGDPLVLASHGYAVLVPNTRGREGYGEKFLRAMSTERSMGRHPHEDVMSGVDALIARGVSDPQRLAVYGHSYGGYLASYVITQTDRFKAAMVYEGGFARQVADNLLGIGGRFANTQITVHGNDDPFDRQARAKMMAESPAFNMDCVTTPTLLVYGALAGADTDGRVLYAGLQRFKIPSEFIIYNEGHAFVTPTATLDRVTRLVAWFDYWVRGQNYPDQGRQRDYDKWQQTPRKVAASCPVGAVARQ